jgi:tubulin polyglutamylase TTLL6/13
MHLTNYAINKESPNFVFNESEKDMSIGHKRSLTSVYDLLAKQGIDVPALK